MRIRCRNLLVVSTSVITLTVSACAGGSSGADSPTATATPPRVTPTATSAVVDISGPATASSLMVHIEALVTDIGPRPAGTAAEREAAAYINRVLTSSGYETTTERFTFVGSYDQSKALLPGDEAIDAFMLDGSAQGNAYGLAVFGGTGSMEDLEGVSVTGNVLVLDRGVIPFADKVRHAEDAGAIAVVIVNHQPGAYQGTLGDLRASIPVLGVPQAARDELIDVAGNGMLTVIASGGRKEVRSQNVVGRTEEPCVAYLGAHYDSVPESVGANDNASGVAMILELARVHYTEGLCIIAFGAEEVGLWGSLAFVEAHPMDDVTFMLNFDMVGKVTDPIIIGDDWLTGAIMTALDASGIEHPLQPGMFPPFASSDHVPFTSVGVPAVTIHSGGDEHMHTALDDIENIDEDSLATMLDASEAMLDGLLAAAEMR